MHTLSPRPARDWQLRDRTLVLGHRTWIMAILNLTPDSFSDGRPDDSTAAAEARGLALLDAGADLLDLGAESTRPNASPLSPEDEQERLLPILRSLRRARPDALLSVDTFHASTARRALEFGADLINDVSGLTWDRDMAPALAAAHPSPGLVLMHSRGTPATWRDLPPLAPAQIPALVRDGLRQRLETAAAAGIPAATITLDPGFGFGKRGSENFVLLAHLADLHALGRPLLVGLSRKGFLAPQPAKQSRVPVSPAIDDARSEARLQSTIAAHTAAILAGAHILRVHDISAALAAASVADRILNALPSPGTGT